MITHQDLVRLWGEENIVLADPGTLTRLHLHPEALQVLIEIGLPRLVERLFAATEPAMLEVPHRPGRWCRIGTEPLEWSNAEFCVEAQTGDVVYLFPAGDGLDRFVNSSLALFVECLYRDTADRIRWSAASDDEVIRSARRLERQLRRIDPPAFADPDHYWAVTFEDVRE